MIVSVLLGRAGDDVGRLYFADLVGAGLGCLLAIPLISSLGPPSVIVLAAHRLRARRRVLGRPGLTVGVRHGVSIASLLLGVGVVRDDWSFPTCSRGHEDRGDDRARSTREWGPVFRVDVVELEPDADDKLLVHDGTFGSGIHRFDGDPTLGRSYETDPRAIPFDVLGGPPGTS